MDVQPVAAPICEPTLLGYIMQLREPILGIGVMIVVAGVAGLVAYWVPRTDQYEKKDKEDS